MALRFLKMSAEKGGGTSHAQGLSAVGRIDLQASADFALRQVEQAEVIKSDR